jgi:hypothetical protein
VTARAAGKLHEPERGLDVAGVFKKVA